MAAASSPTTSTTPRMPTTGCSAGWHSSRDPQGRTASDRSDGPLTPAAFTAAARQTYSAPLVRLPISAVVTSVDPACTGAVQVEPPSLEHSYRKPETCEESTAGTWTRTPWLRAATDGFAGAAGLPSGVTADVAVVQAPWTLPLSEATSQR